MPYLCNVVKLVSSIFAAVAVLSNAEYLLGQTGKEEVTFVKFLTVEKNQPIAGILGRESDTHIEVIALGDGQGHIFKKDDVRQIRKGISEQEIVTSVGLPDFLAWKIHKSIPPTAPVGRILKVDPTSIYVSLGTKVGVKNGHELRVYRGLTELKDPVSGEVLGMERRLVARLSVFDSRDGFSKAKLQGDLETLLEIGDVVESASSNNSIMILPFVDGDGRETTLGKNLSGTLIANLVNRKVPIVERELLGKVLAELLLQQTTLFDPSAAQRVGKQVGGYAALMGKLAQSGVNTDVQIRLVETESGRILFASSHRLYGKSIGDRLPEHPVLPSITASNDPSATRSLRVGNASVIGHWTLDETLANSVLDHQVGDAVGRISWDEGKVGQCLSLRRTLPDGNGPYAVLSQDSRFDLGSKDFCVALWIRPMPGARRWPLLSKGMWGEFGWVFEVLPGGKITFECRVGKDKATFYPITSGNGAVEFDKWQHVAVIVTRASRGKARLLVNGEKVAEGSIPDGDIGNRRFDLDLGRINVDYFHGDLDDVFLVEGEVSNDVIVQLMKAGKPD